jgi:acetate kinase
MNSRAENFVLVLNAGSSSLTFALFDIDSSSVRTVAAVNDQIGSDQASFYSQST